MLLGLALVVALGSGVFRLRIDNSTRGLFLIDDPEVRYLDDVRANFGAAPDLIVVVRSDSLFDAGMLGSTKELVNAIEKVPGVDRTVSLFSAQFVHEETLEYQRRKFRRILPGPLVDTIPESAVARGALEQRIRTNSLLRGTIVNDAGNAMVIQLFLDGRDTANTDEAIVAALNDLIGSFRWEGKAEAYVFGTTFVKAAVTESIRRNLMILGPIAICLVSLIFVASFRSFGVLPIPLLTEGLSTLATLGLMGYAGFAMNPISSTILVLVLVIGCTEDIHLISEFAAGVRNGLTKSEAIQGMGRNVIRAAALAVLTTVLGFLAIVPNPIPQLREFALACAAGVLINFILTLLFLPSLLALLPVPRSFRRRSTAGGAFRFLIARLVRPAIHSRWLVFAAFAAISLIAALGVSRVRVDTNYLRFFERNSAVDQAATNFDRDFGGKSAFAIAVETGRKDGIFKLATFNQLAAFTDRLNDHFDRALSIPEVIREIPKAFDGEGSGVGDLPASQKTLDGIRALLPNSILSAFVDHDGSRALIRVRSSNVGSSGMRRDEESVYRIAGETLPPNFRVHVTGELPLLHRLADRIATQLLQGLLLVLAAILIVFTIAFRSFRQGVIGMLPNIFPSLVTVGVMGWAGIPLSVGTFAIAIVALGISADDTIHFMVRCRDEGGDGDPLAIANAFSKEIHPVVVTTIALTAGFLVLAFSSLVMHREAALLYAVAFISALVADLLLLPCLLLKRRSASPSPCNRDSGGIGIQ